MEKTAPEESKVANHFLKALFGGISKGYLTISEFKDNKTKWFGINEIDEAALYSMNLSNNRDVYFGLGARKKKLKTSQRGTSEDILFLPCIWIEIDLKSGKHSKDNLPDEEQARMFLDTFPLEPSITVHSGGGVHCYWLFNEPVRILTDNDRAGAKRMLERFQSVFIGLAKQIGLHIDNTSDLARVLRVPGTYNHKEQPKPVLVQTMNESRYTLEQVREAIEKLEPYLPSEQSSSKKRFEDLKTDLPDANFNQIKEGCHFIQSYLNNKEGASYSEWMAALSIGSFSEDYEQVCHGLSEGHPGYSAEVTDRKIKEIRTKMKPRLCSSINKEFGTCGNCKYFNKINSPIAIGMKKDNFQIHVDQGDFPIQAIIPLPYLISSNGLFKKVIKKVEGFEVEQTVMVARMAPKILKELSNVERNSVHYEIAWNDRGREKREVVPASTISTKRELMTLADNGFPCNDLNYKDLINYFDKFLSTNALEQSQMVERLGHIKKAFIHPLDLKGVEIVPTDIGEKQLLEAFQTSGTVEGWFQQVFLRVKTHPRALFVVLASFASVLLHDLKIDPFIVDLASSTSQGKTSVLKVAASVWGTSHLVNEFNATKVSMERKAAFLNSFPLIMDDSRKADERLLQSFVYNFSGGKGKGRGSLRGSREEFTWKNIMLTTGEVPLGEYAEKAGGVAARIISLTDSPFEGVGIEFFTNLYGALEENYGAVGLEFLKKYSERRKEFIPNYHKLREYYMGKSKGNEVLNRLSLYYAAVHFAGYLLKEFFIVDVDLKQLDKLFEDIAKENKTIDKPKQLLEDILQDLDSNRDSIYYDHQGYPPKIIKALYKAGNLYFHPSYLKFFLDKEMGMIRKEWLKRGITIQGLNKGKVVDYTQVYIDGRNLNGILIDKAIIEDLGFDFSVTRSPAGDFYSTS
jgi:uncharacterized protein (DUF927 family)